MNYNLGLTLGSVTELVRILLDIFVMWLLLYYAIKIVRNNSRTIQIFKGIVLILIANSIAKFLGLSTVSWVIDIFINWGFLALIIVFQPEIRSVLEKIGTSNVFSRISTLTGNEKEKLVDELVSATMLLSNDQTGALICLEQANSLSDYIKTGTPLNSIVTAELLTSIFVTSTPLHDGAVIIQGDKIACASAYFPPTNMEIPSRYGARHRAAIGISEITDSVTIVVSEETGAVSIAEGGQITQVNRKQLRDYLVRVICGTETEIRSNNKRVVVVDDKKNTNKESEYIVEDKKKENVTKEVKEVIKPVAPIAPVVKEVKQEVKEEVKVVKEEPKVVVEDTKPKIEEKVVKEEKKLEVEQKPKKEKRGLFGFGKKNTEEPVAKEDSVIENEKVHEQSIKLPKKKERPTPSYPVREDVRVMGTTDTNTTSNEGTTTTTNPTVESKTTYAVPHIGQRPNTEEKVETVVEDIKPEIVQEEKVEAVVENTKPRIVPEEMIEEEIGDVKEEQPATFDTTKIDLSAILKASDNLDEQLATLDTTPISKPAVSEVIDIKPAEDSASDNDDKGGAK